MSLPVNYFDMMPIADRHNNYYTGLYSAREVHKAYIRRGGQTLSALNKLFSMEIMHNEIKQDKANEYLKASDDLTKAVAQA